MNLSTAIKFSFSIISNWILFVLFWIVPYPMKCRCILQNMLCHVSYPNVLSSMKFYIREFITLHCTLYCIAWYNILVCSSPQLWLSGLGPDLGSRPGGVSPVLARPPVADPLLQRRRHGRPPHCSGLSSSPAVHQRRRRLRHADCIGRALVSRGQLAELRVHKGNAANVLCYSQPPRAFTPQCMTD